MYRIGLFSKMNRVTIKTLRYYDKTELLKPAFVEKTTGYRYYTSCQLPELHRIITMRQMGLSVSDIKKVQDGFDKTSVLKRQIGKTISVIEENRLKLKKLKNFLKLKKGEMPMKYQCAIKSLPEVTVYSKRITVKNYDEYFQTVPEIGRQITMVNPDLELTDPPYCFTIYHDGEYKEENFNVEICEAVKKAGENTGTIIFKKIDSVKEAACLYHKGPYKTIGNAYGFLFKWIDDNGYKVSGYPRESYIDGIWNCDEEINWLTEIQIPVSLK